MNAKRSASIIVLFDGHCSFCRKTVEWLKALDWLHRLAYVDIHDEPKRRAAAPDVSFEKLNGAMHVKLPDGSYRLGFYAFRRLGWVLPLCWVVTPLLYLPGAALIGERVYVWVAARRSCAHGACKVH